MGYYFVVWAHPTNLPDLSGQEAEMKLDRMECVVIGGGIIALAIARRLAIAGREVLLIGRAEGSADDAEFGLGLPGRPEPVEATIMDPPNTLRAALCARGTVALSAYCTLRGIPFKHTGQLAAAADEAQLAWLKDLCGICDAGLVELLDREAASALEQGLVCAGALLAREAGIVDGEALRLALRIDAEDRGAFITEDTRLFAGYPLGRGFELDLVSGPGEMAAVRCDTLINAAEGVEALQMAARIDGMVRHLPCVPPPETSTRYNLVGTAPFSRLVIPGCRDRRAGALFFPGFNGESWMEIADPRSEASDWMIQGQADHGVRGLINLFGIEPRNEARAALAVADAVMDTMNGCAHWHAHGFQAVA
jgi:glycine/D-amino acid oxidase-like deaminating enzyme